MNLKSPLSIYANSKFGRYEQFICLAQDWNIDFIALNNGLFSGKFLRCGTPDIQIVDIEFNCRIMHRGETPSGYYSFAILKNSSSEFVWQNLNIPHNSIMVFPSTREIDAFSLSGFQAYVVSVSPNLLNTIFLTTDLPEPDEIIFPGEVHLSSSHHIDELRNLIKNSCQTLFQNPSFASHPKLNNMFENTITSKLIEILASSKGLLPKRQRISRKKIVQKIIDHLNTSPELYPSVTDLCRIAKVSERTLRYAFNEQYDISPKSFLQAYRLNKVYRTLQRSDRDSITINDAANKWGFWHMGQFAKDYKLFFGELPSATLNNI